MNKRDYVVGNSDYDGLTSSALYSAYSNATIVGVFDIDKIAFSDKEKLWEAKWIDCDISGINIPSIGHHFLVEEFCVNEKIDNENLKRKVKTFHQKCPFSTALILVSKIDQYKKRLIKDLKEGDYSFLSLIVYADNFYPYIWKKFNFNATDWLQKSGLSFIVDILKDEEFEAIFEKEVCRIKEKIVFENDNYINGRTPQQAKFSKENLNAISDYLKINRPKMENFKYKRKYSIERIQMNKRNTKSLQNELKNGNILSHALVKKNIVSVTFINKPTERFVYV